MEEKPKLQPTPEADEEMVNFTTKNMMTMGFFGKDEDIAIIVIPTKFVSRLLMTGFLMHDAVNILTKWYIDHESRKKKIIIANGQQGMRGFVSKLTGRS